MKFAQRCLMIRLLSLLTHILTYLHTDWLTDWLTDGRTDRPTDRPTDWLTKKSHESPPNKFIVTKFVRDIPPWFSNRAFRGLTDKMSWRIDNKNKKDQKTKSKPAKVLQNEKFSSTGKTQKWSTSSINYHNNKRKVENPPLNPMPCVHGGFHIVRRHKKLVVNRKWKLLSPFSRCLSQRQKQLSGGALQKRHPQKSRKTHAKNTRARVSP